MTHADMTLTERTAHAVDSYSRLKAVAAARGESVIAMLEWHTAEALDVVGIPPPSDGNMAEAVVLAIELMNAEKEPPLAVIFCADTNLRTFTVNGVIPTESLQIIGTAPGEQVMMGRRYHADSEGAPVFGEPTVATVAGPVADALREAFPEPEPRKAS